MSAPYSNCSSLGKKSSSSTLEKPGLSLEELTGTHKVRYHAGEEWDCVAESLDQPIDLSLVLPHYRARHQPVNHRMSVYILSDHAPVKAKICRHMPLLRFYLEVQARTSDVIIWLPSDFKGHIHHSGKASFSDGFMNRIMAKAVINRESLSEGIQDSVVVRTAGHVHFKMWDVDTCASENKGKEAWRRVFKSVKKAPENSVNWDYLLDD